MDEIDKIILEIVSNHPEGLSYRQIWNKLKDEKGNHLVAFPTLLRRVDQLEKRGYLEIERSEWKRGRSVKIKPKISPIVRDILNLLRSIEKSFEDLCSEIEDKYKSLAIRDLFLSVLGHLKGLIIGLRIFQMISEELEKLLQDEIDSTILSISVYHSYKYDWSPLIAQHYGKKIDVKDFDKIGEDIKSYIRELSNNIKGLIEISVREMIEHAKNTEKYLSDKKLISDVIRTLERNLSK